MKGHDFEDLVYEVYQRLGYQVIPMPRVRDGGKDLVVVQDNDRYYVQCKRWKRKVGERQVRELDSVSTHDGAMGSIIVTPRSFTRPAMEYAKNLATPMMLIGGDQLAQMAEQVGIQLDWGSRAEEEVDTVYSFCESVGLPTTLADIGLGTADWQRLMVASQKSCAPHQPIHHEKGIITSGRVLEAMLAADAVGRWRRERGR
jgi:hypothetical protein